MTENIILFYMIKNIRQDYLQSTEIGSFFIQDLIWNCTNKYLIFLFFNSDMLNITAGFIYPWSNKKFILLTQFINLRKIIINYKLYFINLFYPYIYTK